MHKHRHSSCLPMPHPPAREGHLDHRFVFPRSLENHHGGAPDLDSYMQAIGDFHFPSCSSWLGGKEEASNSPSHLHGCTKTLLIPSLSCFFFCWTSFFPVGTSWLHSTANLAFWNCSRMENYAHRQIMPFVSSQSMCVCLLSASYTSLATMKVLGPVLSLPPFSQEEH